MKAVIATLGVLLLSPPVSATPCPIAQSVYRDVEGKGFELVFGAPIPRTGSSKATVTVNHPQQSQIHRFNVTQASGYGSISVTNYPARGNRLPRSAQLSLNFFDQDLRSANPLFLGEETEAPKYAFITGLGSYDYYVRRGDPKQPPLLGDLLWIHDRCQ